MELVNLLSHKKKNKKGPFLGDDLEFFMGHRKPMRWIDEVTEVDEIGGGVTKAIIETRSLTLFDGKVFTSALIEIMGQSYGYIKAVEVKGTDFFLSIAYLAAIDSFELVDSPDVRPGDALITKIYQEHDLHPFYVISATVFKKKHLICKARLKCYANYKRRS